MLKKRILCTIISILMILSLLPMGVSAASGVVSDDLYSSDENFLDETAEKSTIYFCNNKNWKDVYIYGFYGSLGGVSVSEPLGTYPGSLMNYTMTNDYGQDIFSFEIPADIDYLKFCDGTEENNRTAYISNEEFENNALFVLTEKIERYWAYEIFRYIPDEIVTTTTTPVTSEHETDPVKEKGRIFFEADSTWKDVYAYYFGGDGDLIGYWPGTACTNEGGNLWSVELCGEPESIIFSTADGKYQTADLKFAGFDKTAVLTGQYWDAGYRLIAFAEFVTDKDDFEDKTEAKGKIYFKDSRKWGNIYAFTFGEEGYLLGAWPGTPCKYEGNDLWSVELCGEPEGVLFNCPDSGFQTNDILFAGFDKTAMLTGTGAGNRWDASFTTPEIIEIPEKGVLVDGKVYDVNVGDTVTYEVLVEADRVIEDVQAAIRYDSTKLKTEALSYCRNDGAGTNCPNLKYVVYNSLHKDVVKFNASYVDGMDFTEGKVLVTMEFEVLDNSYSEITLDIEEMTIKGDGSESYFEDSETVITNGITVTEMLKGEKSINKTEVRVDGKAYEVNVGDTLTYEVWLTAEEYFENFQGIVYYDSTGLRIKGGNGNKNCPNLQGLVYNEKIEGEVRIVSSYIEGMDFTDKKILVTIDFEVMEEGRFEIRLDVEEMTIKGDGTQDYFTEGEVVITEGITFENVLTVKEKHGSKTVVECIIGDANGDNKVNIKDSTEIQKAVASVVILDREKEAAADVDGNATVNVKDATTVQKSVAGFEVKFPVGKKSA